MSPTTTPTQPSVTSSSSMRSSRCPATTATTVRYTGPAAPMRCHHGPARLTPVPDGSHRAFSGTRNPNSAPAMTYATRRHGLQPLVTKTAPTGAIEMSKGWVPLPSATTTVFCSRFWDSGQPIRQ